jgi:hypothetical protein
MSHPIEREIYLFYFTYECMKRQFDICYKQSILASYYIARRKAKQKTLLTAGEKRQLLLWCLTVVGMLMAGNLEQVLL